MTQGTVYSGTSVFDLLPIRTIRFSTKKFELKMLPNSNIRAGNRKEPSGVETHSALDLAGTQSANRFLIKKRKATVQSDLPPKREGKKNPEGKIPSLI